MYVRILFRRLLRIYYENTVYTDYYRQWSIVPAEARDCTYTYIIIHAISVSC